MELPRRFAGKVAIVTASTQGIGFGIARRLGLEGASVVVSSRKQKNVDEAVAALKSQGIDAIGVVCHVANEKQRNNLIQQTVQKFGHIDVLVSNAAANPSTEPILNMPESILDKLWEVNVKASILLLQAAQPYLSKGSSVILISSISAFHPPPTISMYGVTKGALLALAKALSSELAPDTRINCLALGPVPTHFSGFIIENEAVVSTNPDYCYRKW